MSVNVCYHGFLPVNVIDCRIVLVMQVVFLMVARNCLVIGYWTNHKKDNRGVAKIPSNIGD